MSDSEGIKSAFERSAKAISLRPSIGKGTGISRSRLVNGLRCEVSDGKWSFASDMPESVGGDASAPTPGVYGRAALGSCLAMAYALYAAKLGIPCNAIEVEVQADFDDGAIFGVSDSPAGYLEVRYKVTIESSAPEHEIMRVIDEGDKHSPYLDVFNRAQKCIRNVNIVSPQEE